MDKNDCDDKELLLLLLYANMHGDSKKLKKKKLCHVIVLNNVKFVGLRKYILYKRKINP